MEKLNRKRFLDEKYLFVFDLDGTLLNSRQKILPKTKAIIQELKGYGNIITLASGRPERAVAPYFEELGLSGTFVCHNGALVVNPSDPAFIPLKKFIPKEVIYRFFSRFPESGFVNYMIEDERTQYYLKPNLEYPFFFAPEGMNHVYGSVFDTIASDMLSFVIQSKDVSRNQEIEEFVRAEFPEYGIRFWHDAPNFGEFYHHNINKVTGVSYVARMYHIDNAHVVCFGDAMNDMDMITSCGISFAMKNGVDKIKEAAKFITPATNDEEGIYLSLLDYFSK